MGWEFLQIMSSDWCGETFKVSELNSRCPKSRRRERKKGNKLNNGQLNGEIPDRGSLEWDKVENQWPSSKVNTNKKGILLANRHAFSMGIMRVKPRWRLHAKAKAGDGEGNGKRRRSILVEESKARQTLNRMDPRDWVHAAALFRTFLPQSVCIPSVFLKMGRFLCHSFIHEVEGRNKEKK